MSTTVTTAVVVYRIWDEQGMREEEYTFNTVAELYEFCLKPGDNPELHRIHRVVIKGRDATGVVRQLTLGFKSLTS